jgi:transposase InsO family protein
MSIGRKRVARLMRAAGLVGVSRRKWICTTVRDRDVRPAPDLVERNFVAQGPNALWVADITYIPTWAGFLYLAVVLDAFSRRIVGWAMATQWKWRRSSNSHSRVAKKLSHIALSKQSPTEPIDGRTRASRQRSPKAIEVYWVP